MDSGLPPTSPPNGNDNGLNNLNYNEDFAMDINKRMRVPSQIMVGPSNDLVHDAQNMINERTRVNSEYMHVPDRISLAGNEKHIATREPPPEFKLEGTYLGVYDHSKVNKNMIATPPRVLRIEDVAPAEVEKKRSPAVINHRLFETPRKSIDGTGGVIGDGDIRSNDSILDPEDVDREFVFQRIRRRFLLLDQRLDTLEIELARRNRRDFLLYTLGAIYLVFRGITWFGSRGNAYL